MLTFSGKTLNNENFVHKFSSILILLLMWILWRVKWAQQHRPVDNSWTYPDMEYSNTNDTRNYCSWMDVYIILEIIMLIYEILICCAWLFLAKDIVNKKKTILDCFKNVKKCLTSI